MRSRCRRDRQQFALGRYRVLRHGVVAQIRNIGEAARCRQGNGLRRCSRGHGRDAHGSQAAVRSDRILRNRLGAIVYHIGELGCAGTGHDHGCHIGRESCTRCVGQRAGLSRRLSGNRYGIAATRANGSTEGERPVGGDSERISAIVQQCDLLTRQQSGDGAAHRKCRRGQSGIAPASNEA
jgi:hypothetical protein